MSRYNRGYRYKCQSTYKNGIINYLVNHLKLNDDPFQVCVKFLKTKKSKDWFEKKNTDWMRVSSVIQGKYWKEFTIFAKQLKEEQNLREADIQRNILYY